MTNAISDYRQKQLQKLFKKDMAAIEKFLVPKNIVNISTGSTNEYTVGKNASIHFFKHSPIGKYVYKADGRASQIQYTFDFGVHSRNIVSSVHFRINNYIVTELLLGEEHFITIQKYLGSPSGSRVSDHKLTFTYKNIDEYKLDKLLYVKIKEKRFDNHIIDSLLKGYINNYGEEQ